MSPIGDKVDLRLFRSLIRKGFWMRKYETTQAEYLAVMGSNPSYFTRTGDLERPVVSVFWFLE